MFPIPAPAQKYTKDAPLKHPETAPVFKKPTTGSLVILTEPPTAEVFLNHRSQGKTAADGALGKPVTVKPGSYLVVVKHPDYEEFRETVAVRAGVPTPVKATLTAKFGFVQVSFAETATGASLQLDGIPVPNETIETVSEKSLQIKTGVGKHEVTVTRAGFEPVRETVEVQPAQIATVAVALKRLTAELTLQAPAGARLYLDGKAEGTVPESGRLVVPGLSAGREIKVTVECFGFESFTQPLALKTNEKNLLAPALKPLPVDTEFADNFQEGTKFWNAPPEWSAAHSILFVKPAKSVGLVKNKWFCDGDVYFGVRMQNERGASWVLRAQNDKNYYLFCLNGPAGPYPNTFQTYLCRDGVLNLNEPLVPGIKLPPVKAGETFRVHIRMNGGTVEHWLTPAKTGEDISIGFFKAPNNPLLCGGIGFATPHGEDFQINGFLVQPLK